MKKAFTLFEIVVVVLLISIVYYFTFINLNVNSKKEAKGVTLYTLKEKLLEIDFHESLELKCVNDGELCFIFIDGIKNQDNTIKELFKTKPEVYSYDRNFNRIFYKRLEFEDLIDYDVCFEYKIDKYRKTSDLILDTMGDGVFVFNSIHKKPVRLEYLNEVSDYFDNLEQKVKDAF